MFVNYKFGLIEIRVKKGGCSHPPLIGFVELVEKVRNVVRVENFKNVVRVAYIVRVTQVKNFIKGCKC